MRRLPLAIALLLASLTACAGDSAGPGGPDAAPPPGPTYTWHRDIAPLVAEHCWGCHVQGGIAPVSFETYAGAAEASGLIASKTAAREMPPWGAGDTDDCQPRFGFQNDPRLDDAEIEMFQVWHDEGAPEGDPDTATPLPEPPAPRTLTGVTDELVPATPFTTSGEDDQLICIVLDPGLTGARWLTGMEVIPGQPEAVHHVVLTAVPPDQVAAVQAMADEHGRFECFGGLNLAGLYPLGVWVPGSDPMELPSGIGVPMVAGTQVIMQMHYHPAGHAYSDLTRARLRMTSTFPGKNYVLFGVGNAFQAPQLLPGPDDRGAPEFRIPAGARAHTEEMSFPIALQSAQRFPLLTAFPHEHYLGVKQSVWIERATPNPDEPAEECLLGVPRWNFDWQRTYAYDAPLDQLPTVGNGDTIHIRCEFDNTTDNPFVVRALEEQGLTEPVDVYLGETTLDEMCLAAFGVIF